MGDKPFQVRDGAGFRGRGGRNSPRSGGGERPLGIPTIRARVVHHLLVRRLEEIWEPVFIFDSYACRKGKGTHAAVRRLQSFTRKVTANRTRPAWFMKIWSFWGIVFTGATLSFCLRQH
ncbi:MAG: hypothetical protein FJ135_03050 [Deltaproteobacteria bacterium]|nr:hypothetical protein [Deltaproteobacteria bacterium]